MEIRSAIAQLVRGEDLGEDEMGGVMKEIIGGQATPAQIGAFITALRIKGETVEEITGAARVHAGRGRRLEPEQSFWSTSTGMRSTSRRRPSWIPAAPAETGPGPSTSPPPPPLWRPAPGSRWPSTVTGPSPASAAAPMCWRAWGSTWTSPDPTWKDASRRWASGFFTPRFFTGP